MELSLGTTFGWKYLESLQKKDAPQGLNTGGHSQILSFLQVSVDTGIPGCLCLHDKTIMQSSFSNMLRGYNILSGPVGHKSLE